MSFDVHNWLEILTSKMQTEFAKRLLFVGLQGSYFRGEATDESDVDVIVILDSLSICDLRCYREIIESMEHHEKACGFLCGKAELEAWPKQDIFHLIYDSEAIYGDLSRIIRKPTDEEIRNSIRFEVSNIYHDVCHRYLYTEDLKAGVEKLRGAYKKSFFIMQEMVFLNTHRYVKTKQEMLTYFDKETRDILYNSMMWDYLKEDREARPECYFTWLVEWSSKVLKHYNTYYRWSLARN